MGLDAHSFFVDSFSHFGRHKRIGSPVPGTWAERAVHFCVCMSYLHAVFATLDPKVTISATDNYLKLHIFSVSKRYL